MLGDNMLCEKCRDNLKNITNNRLTLCPKCWNLIGIGNKPMIKHNLKA